MKKSHQILSSSNEPTVNYNRVCADYASSGKDLQPHIALLPVCSRYTGHHNTIEIYHRMYHWLVIDRGLVPMTDFVLYCHESDTRIIDLYTNSSVINFQFNLTNWDEYDRSSI